jgi:hypothetical protein
VLLWNPPELLHCHQKEVSSWGISSCCTTIPVHLWLALPRTCCTPCAGFIVRLPHVQPLKKLYIKYILNIGVR